MSAIISYASLVASMFTNPCNRISLFSLKKYPSFYGVNDNTQPANENEDIDVKMKLMKHNVLSVAAAVLNVPAEVFTTSPPTDPYPPKTEKEKEHRRQVNDILSNSWSFTAGLYTPQEETDEIDRLMGADDIHQPSTYGEITHLGSRQLFHCFNLSSKSTESSKDDIHTFFDLGCGVGKLLVQAYLELPSLSKIVGIEISKDRYDIAVNTWKELQNDAQHFRTNIIGASNVDLEIYLGDLYNLDISSATHIYVASLCFTDNMMDKLAEKIIGDGKNVQSVATLKAFPEKYHQNLGSPSISYIEMSWTEYSGKGAKVFFYNL